MSAPQNTFAAVLAQQIVAVLQSPEAQIPATVKPADREEPVTVAITDAKTEDPATCPRIVVKVGTGEEAIYQSGIYKVPLEISVVTDIDTADAAAANEIFARVVDVVQWTTLKAILNATGKVFIHGFGAVTLIPNEQFGDRQWIESVQLDVNGFAL